MKKFLFVPVAATCTALILAACAVKQPQTSAGRSPLVGLTPDPQPPTSIGVGVNAIVAPSITGAPAANYVVDADPALVAQVYDPFPPTPKKKKEKFRYVGMPDAGDRLRETTKATQSTIESIDTPTNSSNTGGFLFIPADPHGAAGPNHLVTVANVSIEFLQKDGTVDLSTSLQSFFGALSPAPANFTFDPKVLYDQYEGRFVVVTLERTDTGNGDAGNTSNVLLAVSDDDNPNGTWTFTRINTSVNISGQDHWLDYPGFAVDEEAVYITGNMFQYFGGTAAPGTFGGVRMVIVDKGVTGGFYDGSAAVSNIFDPIPGGLIETTTQPAHTYGTVTTGVGTWMMGAGLTNGTDEFFQIIRVDDPLGTPTFSGNFLNIGDIDNVSGGFPDGPQAGTGTDTSGNIGVSTNDRRALDAVWRDDAVWVSHSYQANSGVDSGDVTAGWAEIDTSILASPIVSQRGGIGGENIVAGAFTFFPSLAVNDDGGLMVGFSATEATINPGAYFAYRSPGDAAGTTRDAISFRTGLDYYQRRFSGTDNRWGDYTATALDPDGECFWIYNKYSITRGSSTGTDDDGRWGSAIAHFCNDAPTATADTANVDNGGTVTELASTDDSVLDNDSDVDTTDTLSASVVTGPDHASSFTLNADGTFSYTHDGGADLSDTVTYEACDDGSPQECTSTTLTFTIAPGTNTAPNAVADATTVAEGGTTTTVNGGDSSVLDNDSDPDMDNLTVTTTPVAGPAQASSFSLNANGTFSYTHNGGETTSDSFTYEVCDDGSPQRCSNAAVTITITEVNDPVSVSGETLSSVSEDLGTRFVSFTDLLANDSAGTGETGQTLTITNVTSPVGGTASIAGSAVEFTPTANFNGTASFVYTVSDDGTTNGAPDFSTADATASFTITEVNDPVEASGETLANVAEDAGTQTYSFASLLANDNPGSGESGQTITITAVSGAVGGSVNINGTNVEFTPTADFNGAASFAYTVTDNGTTNGVSDPSSVDAVAGITVTEVNDLPEANPESLPDVAEDAGTQTFSFASLLANDNPGGGETGQTLTISAVSNPVGGSVEINGTDVEFTPTADFAGAASFTYTVTDDGSTNGASDPASSNATASFSIVGVNDPVIANGENLGTIPEDSPTQIYPFNLLLANDDAGDPGQTLTVSAVSNPMGGTVVISGSNVEFTPAANFNGPASFDYTVTDDGTPNPQSADATASLTITEVNDPAIANGETLPTVAEDPGVLSFPFSTLLDNDSPGIGDEDQTLTITGVSGGVGGGVIINGTSVDFSPNPDFNGAAAFTYTVTDNGTTNGASIPASASTSATFTITEVNDPPTPVADDLGSFTQGITLITFDLVDILANDGPGGGEFGQIVSLLSVSSPVGGSVSINGSTIEFVPDTGFIGTASFSYTVEDDGTTNGSSDPQQATGSASFDIVSLNGAPNLADDEYFVDTNQTLTDDVSVNDSDPEGDPLTYTVAIQPASGTVDLASNGSFTYTPATDFNGVDQFTYEASDGITPRQATVLIRVGDELFIDSFETVTP